MTVRRDLEQLATVGDIIRSLYISIKEIHATIEVRTFIIMKENF